MPGAIPGVTVQGISPAGGLEGSLTRGFSSAAPPHAVQGPRVADTARQPEPLRTRPTRIAALIADASAAFAHARRNALPPAPESGDGRCRPGKLWLLRERDSASVIPMRDSKRSERSEGRVLVDSLEPDSAVIHTRPEGGGRPVIPSGACGISHNPANGANAPLRRADGRTPTQTASAAVKAGMPFRPALVASNNNPWSNR